MKKLLLLSYLVLLVSLTAFAQTTRYVTVTGNGTKDGSSWNNASDDIQLMFNASASGDQVFVANGTYKPNRKVNATNTITINDRNNAFLLKNGVKLYGGFDPDNAITDLNHNRTFGAMGTILSGDLGIEGDNTDNAYHVVVSVPGGTASADIYLNGLTITAGNANGTSNLSVLDRTLYSGEGAGLYLTGNSSAAVVLNNLNLLDNIANSSGGGMFSSFSNYSLLTVTNSVITGNKANSRGGAIHTSLAEATFYNNVISDNFANYGSAIYLNGFQDGLTLINNTIVRNKGNSFIHFILVNNSKVNIYNSVVYGNIISATNLNNSSIIGNPTKNINHSLVQNESNTVNGNLDGASAGYTLANLFTNAANDIYTLASGSALINRGNNAYVKSSKDLSSHSRVYDNLVDIGAFEYQSGAVTDLRKPDENGVLYVKKGSEGIGNSWSNAMGELADALLFAKHNNNDINKPKITQIWVSKGTYRPMYSPSDLNFGTDQGRDNAFLMLSNVSIYGGFSGKETSLTQRKLTLLNTTKLSGDINSDDQVTGTGLTLNFQRNAENTHHVVVAQGDLGTAELNGFTIEGGNANGGNTFFTINGNNFFRHQGGAFYNRGAIYKVENCIIKNNWADNFGGAIINASSSSVSYIGTLIYNNKAGDKGIVYNSSETTFINCTITANGNAIASNGVIYTHTAATTNIYNSVIYANNSGSENLDGTVNQHFSLMQGSTSIINGNIVGTTDPQFVNPTLFDFRLKNTSPVLNKGSNTYFTTHTNNATDLAGNQRIKVSTIDLGVYESSYGYTPTGNILYVDKHVVGGDGTGSSWANAIPELGDALLWANAHKTSINTNSVSIYVAKGTYYPMYSPVDGANFGTNRDRENTFLIVPGLKLYGGFSPNDGIDDLTKARLFGTNGTILSGDYNNDDDNAVTPKVISRSENAYHVLMSISINTATLVDGFTITNGNANASPSARVSQKTINNTCGAGLYIDGSAPLNLSNLIVEKNSGEEYGAGIYTINSTVNIVSTSVNNNVLNNYPSVHGGGIYSTSSNITMKNVELKYNKTLSGSFSLGAAIFVSSTTMKLINAKIIANESSYSTIYNVSDNYPIKLINTTICNNTIGITNNQAGIILGSAEIYNSIFYGNSKNEIGIGTFIVKNSITQGASATDAADGILAGVNPFFIDIASGDFRLNIFSPAINKGSNQFYTDNEGNLTTDKDLVGNNRLFAGTIDMGAYESQTEPLSADAAGILYVNKGALGTGNSWNNALGELADALLFAKTNNASANNVQVKEIWVAKGSYKPMYSPADANLGTNQGRDNAFLMVNDVKLYGGFDPDNGITALTHARLVPDKNGAPIGGGGTILSGDLNGDDGIYSSSTTAVGNTNPNNGNNAYQIVVAVSNNVAVSVNLDGFIIKDGNANSTNPITINGVSILRNNGGGIFSSSSSSSSSVSLTNTSVNNNTSTSLGGGISSSSFSSSSVSLTNSSVNNNTSTSLGGGISSVSNSSSTSTSSVSLINSRVNNNAAEWGGGINTHNSSSSTSLSSVSLMNASLNNNFANYGAAIYTNISSSPVSSSTTVKLLNSLLSSNKGSSFIYFQGSGSSSFIAYNSMVYGNVISTTNSGNATLYGSPTKDIKNSLVQGESSTSNGNLDGTSASYTLANLFTDAANGDYTLKNGSAAINAGNNQLYTDNGGNIATDKDLADKPRLFDGTIDMGAYENQTVQVLPVNFGEFTATKQTNNVKLSWNTFSETNNKGFLVQKSTDGKNFTDLTFVASKGTAGNNYTLLDNSPVNGANYYRLVQQDIDGKQTDLGTKVVNYVLANADVKAWPNPVSTVLNISFAAGKYQEITLLDISGKTLQRLALTANQTVAQLDLAVYPKGIYILNLKGIEGSHQIKVVK